MSHREARILIDDAAAGDWNMAVDEALLESAAAGGPPTLRFYRWEAPTLSLGYFQPYEERSGHAASTECPVVRRASGGGAIVHDREVTYSVCLPPGHRLAVGAAALYDAMHESLIESLVDFGVQCRMCRADSKPNAPEPFLCFERRTVGDVLLGEVKVAGSAQRRRRGAVLQHGSVLLVRSTAAPELPGICDLAQTAITSADLYGPWTARIAARLGVDFRSGTLDAEIGTANRLVEKYSGDKWVKRR